MDLEQIATFISASKNALQLFKGIRDELPKNAAVSEQISKAESALALTEVEAARTLDYRICRCAWPPTASQIMLWDKERRKDVCRACGDVNLADPPTTSYREPSLVRARRGR